MATNITIETGTNTCPCCFRSGFQAKGGYTSRHGYRVINSGYGGWQTGGCGGSRFLRFEESCEGTEYALAGLKSFIESNKKRLEELAARPALYWEPTNPYARYNKAHQYDMSNAPAPRTLLDGAEEIYGYFTVPSYDAALAKAVRQAEANIAGALRDVDFLQGKIVEWHAARDAKPEAKLSRKEQLRQARQALNSLISENAWHMSVAELTAACAANGISL